MNGKDLKQIRITVENYNFLKVIATQNARQPAAQLGVMLNEMRLEREANKSK